MSAKPVAEASDLCGALTAVVEASKLADRIDASAFHALLQANMHVLVQENAFLLEPLWSTVRTAIGWHPCLPGLFVGLARRLEGLGFAAQLPTSIAKLEATAQAEELEKAFPAGLPTTSSPQAPPPPRSQPEPPTTADTAPLALGSQDIEPVITDDIKRQAVQVVARSLRGCKIKEFVNISEIEYHLATRFDELCDGESFDLVPLIESLRGLEGFSDRLIYVGLVRAHYALADINLKLLVPALDLSEEEAQELLAESQTSSIDIRPGRRPNLAQKTSSNKHRMSADLRRQEKLREYHLLGMSPKTLRLVRRVSLAVLLVASGVTAWVTRPNQSLDASDFPLPLVSAQIQSREFTGVLDDPRWYALPLPSRKVEVQKMGDYLQARRLLTGATIFDRSGRLVIRTDRSGRFKASRWVLESPDGIKPPPKGKPIKPGEVPIPSETTNP